MNESALCSKTHEYILELENNQYEIGITDYAIEQLGDIVFVELPEVGSTFVKNEVFATIESVKAASEVYMPVGGKVIAINEAIVDSPEALNDETVEGLRYKKFKGLSVQFTPKGDIDSSTGFIIRDFYKMMDGEENA